MFCFLCAICVASCVLSEDAAMEMGDDGRLAGEQAANEIFEVFVSRGKCEDGCEAAMDRWHGFCKDLPASIRRQCHEEKMQGLGNCHAACRSGVCENGWVAYDNRWALYCNERVPGQFKLVCHVMRTLGRNDCQSECR